MTHNKDSINKPIPEPGQERSLPGSDWKDQVVPAAEVLPNCQAPVPASPRSIPEPSMKRFSSLDDLILILNHNGYILEVNKPALRQLDYTLSELEGSSIADLYPENKSELIHARIHAMKLQDTALFKEPIRTKDGFTIPVETRLSWGDWREQRVLFWVSRGNSAVENSSYEAVEHASVFFRTVYDTAAVPVVFFHLDGKILEANQSFQELAGRQRDQLLNRKFQNLLPEEEILLHKKRLQKIISGSGSHSQHYETRIYTKNSTIHVNCLLLMIRGQNGKPLYFINHMQNVTPRKKFEEQLQHLATHDPLTDLPNRTMLQDRFVHAVSIAKRHGKLIGLVLLDLDDFKVINDSHGHEIGDRLLIEIANRLRSAVRESDTVARIGGDEFVILLEGISNSRDALKVLEKALDKLSEPVSCDELTLDISASAGLSTYPFDGDTLARLLRSADFAMYNAKGMGNGRIGLPEFPGTREQLAMFNLDELELEKQEKDPPSENDNSHQSK